MATRLKRGTQVRVHFAMGSHTIDCRITRLPEAGWPDWYGVEGADSAGSFRSSIHREMMTIIDNRPNREVTV